METLKKHILSSGRIFVVTLQIALIVVAFVGAFLFRFDGAIPERYWDNIRFFLFPVIALKLFIFYRTGLFSGWWRYVSLPDLWVILRANAYGSVALFVFAFLVERLEGIPRSVYILDGIFCFLMMAGVRVVTRAFRENNLMNRKNSKLELRNVLILGAGGAGQAIVKEIRQNPTLSLAVLGYIDEDAERQQESFQGVPVLGTPRDLKRIFQETHVNLLIVAKSAICRKELRPLVTLCQEADVEIKLLPTVGDILNDQVSVRHIRNVQLEDLLGREPVRLEIDQIREFLHGRRVLVTGAGGSIGSEICRQVAAIGPACLIISDVAETPLFHIENELKELYPALTVQSRLSDIRDRIATRYLFQKFSPEIVFHAAAYKHVPMSEQNLVEAVKNNVLGTRNLADTAQMFGVRHFVMISTDKAVNPTNAMGASKRIAEIYVQALSRRTEMKVVTVRFGNVLGSNGSVVPTFRQQIEKGGPVTVTHPEVTRFFMTIPEAVQLVMQAASMGKGGEIFLLDMGHPVKIVGLAEEMIRLSGLRPYQDVDIVFTGLRPGEKLHEELLLAGEGIMPTSHEKIRVARSTSYDEVWVDEQIENLFRAAQNMDQGEIFLLLRKIVPEYQPGLQDTEFCPLFTSERLKPLPVPRFIGLKERVVNAKIRPGAGFIPTRMGRHDV